jgi:4-hydroxy-3-methylbut-2-enyl diphosphate reductase
VLVQQIIERLRSLGVKQVRTMDGVEETMAFKLPKGLMD